MSEMLALLEILKNPFAGAIIFGCLSVISVYFLLKIAFRNVRLELEKKIDDSINEFSKFHSDQIKDVNTRIDNVKDQFHSSEVKIHQLILQVQNQK